VKERDLFVGKHRTDLEISDVGRTIVADRDACFRWIRLDEEEGGCDDETDDEEEARADFSGEVHDGVDS